MGLFNDWFNWSPEENEEYQLGRFSDAYKPHSSYKKWESSLLKFEEDAYIESAELFFEFLKNPLHENLLIKKSEKGLKFQFFQGSKIIQGSIDNTAFRAEAKIAYAEEINIGLMRKLLDRNYLLKYSRFALDKFNNIIILFDSYTIDASPNKLYQGLKELAIQADKLDDILVDEFKGLQHINNSHVILRTEEIKEKQYQYLIRQMDICFEEVENGKLNTDQFPGGLSYLLLALNYKIDYLLNPEGFLMDIIEQNHRSFFTSDGKETGLKNKLFIKAFKKIRNRDKNEIKNELYDVISTFGVTTPSTHDDLRRLIETELINIDWYKENNHTAIAQAIPDYIVGYCLFNYALPLPDMKLLQLYFKIREPEFFDIGKKSNLIKGGKPNSRNIKKAIEKIVSQYSPIYPNLKARTSILDFSNMVNFSESYLILIKSLDLNTL